MRKAGCTGNLQLMTTYIALLRAVNVGGHNKVAMADLRVMMSAMNFAECRTLLQSGNAVFRAPAAGAQKLEIALEKEITLKLGVTCDFVIRTASQWRELIAANPFVEQAIDSPKALVVMCLKAAPTEDAVKALRASIKGREEIAAVGPELYIWYPDHMGESRFTNSVIEKRLGMRGTARNWNTVRKLMEMSAARSDP